jgi:nudix-type nucleoside diphosphatase (YffH/AdpP family)
MSDPEIVERQAIYSGFISVDRVKVRLSGGAEVWRDIERHGAAAAILPYDPERGCALVVRQFRAPVFVARGDMDIEEACAGEIVQEAPRTAARREALEELGVLLHGLEEVACVWSSPGVSDEQVSLYLAPYGQNDLVERGGGVAAEHEDIQVVERGLPDMAASADRGLISDVKLLVLIQTLRLRQPALFRQGNADVVTGKDTADPDPMPIHVQAPRLRRAAVH